MNRAEAISWSSENVSMRYLDAISDIDRHIAVNKLHYHDPDFYHLVPDLSGKTVLDIGCGNYYMDLQLQTQYPNARFIGLDYPTMLKAANEQNSEYGNNPIHLVGGSADKLPFANDSIDFVISSLLFHWLADIDQVAREMHRVLRPGTGFVVSVAHPDYFKAGEFEKNESGYLFRRTRATTVHQQISVMLSKNIGPILYYSRPVEYYKTIFENVGFTNVTMSAPLFTDQSKLNEYEHLSRHTRYPLHLFVKGAKASE